MPRADLAARGVRALASAGIGLLGTLGVVALSLGMNAQVERRVEAPATVIETALTARRPPPARKPTSRAPAPRRERRAVAVPAGLLAADLSGLDFGLGDPADLALAEATAALIRDAGAEVVDEAAVERAPRPITRTPPSYPPRARALGLTGHVTVAFVVDVDGSVADVTVVDAEPPDVFDDAATDAVSSWRFEPGADAGGPVAVRVRQTLTFELE